MNPATWTRRRRVERGFCRDCAEPRDPGSSRCTKCRAIYAAYMRDRNRVLNVAGLCIQCLHKNDRSTYRCSNCLEGKPCTEEL